MSVVICVLTVVVNRHNSHTHRCVLSLQVFIMSLLLAVGVIRHLPAGFQRFRCPVCGHAHQFSPAPYREDRWYRRLQTAILPVSTPGPRMQHVL